MSLPKTQEFDCAFIENADNQFEVAKILCSLANSHGGTLYIGIKSNGKVKGVYPNDVLNQLDEMVSTCIKPSLQFTNDIIEEGLKLVVCVKIPFEPKNKYQVKLNQKEWEFFVRINQYTIPVNKIIRRSWIDERKSTASTLETNSELKAFLKVISINQPVSLSKLYKAANMPLDKVDKYLSTLVSLNEVVLAFDGNTIIFSVKS
jgi:predicted HTH transcriptional regulator